MTYKQNIHKHIYGVHTSHQVTHALVAHVRSHAHNGIHSTYNTVTLVNAVNTPTQLANNNEYYNLKRPQVCCIRLYRVWKFHDEMRSGSLPSIPISHQLSR